MMAARAASDIQSRPDLYQKQMQYMNQLNGQFRMAAQASGQWHVQTVKTISASEQLTKSINQQKLSWGQMREEVSRYRKTSADVFKNGGSGGSALREAIREQQALRGAMASQLTGNAFGKNNTDMFIPRNLGSELDNARVKYGMMNRMIAAAAHQTVNWGKNTQWAGRQIMVGLTVPLGMLAVGAGVLAAKIDSELTRVAKVYDTVSTNAQAREKELANVREIGLKQATRLAGEYGMKMQDTIDIQAQLAATGMNGNKLFGMTSEVGRIATLGEMDSQTAIDMTVALTTAFRDQIKTTDDLAETFDFFNTVENATSLQIKDIAAAIPRAASAMSALGVSTKEMTTLMVALRESGVDPEIGANALKSATSTLLDPSQEAIDYWKETLGKDLPAIVKEAGGNLFEFMKAMGEALHGMDPQIVQTAVTKTFGKYQFDRATALVTNFGDAMTGTANQTAKAMELMGRSAAENATSSANELVKLQESVSFKFKAAVESVKAELIPLGEVALKVGTFILDYLLKPVLNFFNSMNDPVKIAILSILGFGAVIGPLLMITGIFANLFGNLVKGAMAISNLHLKFKALTVEEAAAQINARNAASAFSAEASSAAHLAQSIQSLTAAMEANAVAAGQMMSKNGTMMNMMNGQAVGQRQVVQRANGTLAYGPGSTYAPGTIGSKGQDLSGKNAAGHSARTEDVKRWQQIQASSAATAGNAERTSRGMATAAKAAGGLMLGVTAISVMAAGSESINYTWLNIAMIVAMTATLFPTMFATALTKMGLMLTAMKTMGSAAVMGKLAAGATQFSNAWRVGGIRAVGSTMGMAAGQLWRMIPMAAKLFGAAGLIAGGVYLIKMWVDKLAEAEDAARAIASSGEDWANAVGWDYNPGQLPGMADEDMSNQAARIKLINEMSKANEGLAESMVRAKNEGREYEAAMAQAISAITSGATVAQARQVMEAALDMAGVDTYTIDELMVKFDRVNLEDPEGIRNAIANQIRGSISLDLARDLRLTDTSQDNDWLENVSDWFRDMGGGVLTDEARAAGVTLGKSLSDGIAAAGNDTDAKREIWNSVRDEMNGAFDPILQELQDKHPKVAAAMEDLGITTADEYFAAMKEALNEDIPDDALSAPMLKLRELLNSKNYNAYDSIDFMHGYQEMIDSMITGMVEADMMTEYEAEEIKKHILGVADFAREEGGIQLEVITKDDALKGYNDAIGESIALGEDFTEAEQLALLNVWRHAAGLDDATSVTQGFGDASEVAADQVEDLATAIANATYSGEQLAGGLKNAMSGAARDIESEAQRLWEDSRQAGIESIRAAGENRQAAMDAEGNAQDKEFDRREKEMDNFWDQAEKNLDNSWKARIKGDEAWWDDRIKRLEDERDAVDETYQARIDGINDAIKAEQDAETKRQKIFDAEQRRIERMAARLNSSLDFNTALNSGNLDEAAKISNDVSARDQSWSLEDRDREMGDASEQRVNALEGKIDAIEIEREARKTAFDEQIEQTKAAKDAHMEALKEREDAERESLRIQRQLNEDRLADERQVARDTLAARMETDRKTTDANVARAQADFESDKRSLANRLRALQEFIPQNEGELRQHAADVAEVYRVYGIDLTTQGYGWAGTIGNALRTNVDIAAASLQQDIKWQAIGANIAAQVGAGMGMTVEQVRSFLTTGVFPPGAGVTAPTYKPGAAAARPPAYYNPATGAHNVTGPQIHHAGGDVPYTGGKSMPSQKSRVGIPRSASIYPTEVPALLRAGEFVVNQKATAKHRGILEAINSGDAMPSIAHHDGGLADYTAGLVGMQGVAIAQTMGAALQRKLEIAKAEYEASLYYGDGNSMGIEGSGPMYQRLFATIKRQFPRANLNSGLRTSNDYHGKGMAVDLGEQGFAGGLGRPYLAAMNRWIYDNYRGSTELIYNGTGDDRPNLKNGANFAYNAATQAQHRNHVHWAMTPSAALNYLAGRGDNIAGAAPSNVTGNQAIVKNMAASQYGWAGPQWDALYKLIMKESGFRNTAQNPTSTAYGMFQFLDSTWGAYGARKTSDPAAQTAAGLRYIKQRYGTPMGALQFHLGHNWYDNGGYLMPGQTQVMNGTGKPEPVFTAPQWDVLKANINNSKWDLQSLSRTGAAIPVRIVENVAAGSDNTYTVNVDLRGAYIKEEIDIEDALNKALDARESKNGRRRVIA